MIFSYQSERPARLLWAVLAILATLSTATHAGPYSDLIVFGDSLSDVGNTNSWTLGAFPGGDYFDGRFSNGPTYAERLSEGLGFGTLLRDGEGGDNFAYGGAETNGPGFFSGGALIESLVDQVDNYFARLDGATPDPDTLFVVFIGANDFLLAEETNPATPAGVVRSQFDRLVGAGAENFLGVNLPLLGLTPDHLGDGNLTGLAAEYNEALLGVYDEVELAYSEVTIHRLDVETLFSDLIADPAPLGFTNTTDPGQTVAGSSLDRAPGYVFWDGVHPTRELHALLGEAAIRTVLPAGDYDRDGVVTPDDYTAWDQQYGVAFNAALGQTPSLAGDGNGDGRIDAADYTLWRDRLSPAGAVVPEPAAITMALAVAMGWQRRPI